MRPRQFTDEQLFATARALILEHGPSVSAARIARALGISAAALFKRVGTKQELLRRALIGATVPAFIGIIEAGPDDRPVKVQLLALGQQIEAFFKFAMPAINMCRAAGVCPADVFAPGEVPPPIRAVRGLTAWLEKLKKRGEIRVPNPEAVAVAFLGALQARHAMVSFLGEAYPSGGDKYVEHLVTTILSGIQTEKSGESQ